MKISKINDNNSINSKYNSNRNKMTDSIIDPNKPTTICFSGHPFEKCRQTETLNPDTTVKHNKINYLI